MSFDPIESLRAQLAGDGAMRRLVDAILDRCDQTGALPGQMTLRCRSTEDQDAAVRLLSPSAVGVSHNSLRLALARADTRLRAEGWPGLSDVLYAAAGRPPRNLRGEAAAIGTRAADMAETLGERRAGAAARFLRATVERLARCRGELFEVARSKGLSNLEEELEVTARCIELAEGNDRPVRLANFARRATGSSKGLRVGDRRYTRVVDALLAHLPGLAERVAAERLGEPADQRRVALECLNIFRNETPVDVLCWGHFVLEKKGRRLEAPAIHHEWGEPCRLLLMHLRDAQVVRVRGERVVSIENETTYNDYVEWLRERGREEIVLLTEGQANWAVVRLLRLLAEAAPGLPLAHWGDLDRFGVLILRSLRRRTGLPIEPCWMDVATFDRCKAAGLSLPEGEREEIDSLLSSSSEEVGSSLLRAIRNAGVWIEQEAVAEVVLTH
jgi:hypothetical protein